MLETCSKCGFPIHPNDEAIRHCGFSCAHSENRCNELFKREIERINAEKEQLYKIIKELIDAMNRYQMDAETEAPFTHRMMMENAFKALAPRKTITGETIDVTCAADVKAAEKENT